MKSIQISLRSAAAMGRLRRVWRENAGIFRRVRCYPCAAGRVRPEAVQHEDRIVNNEKMVAVWWCKLRGLCLMPLCQEPSFQRKPESIFKAMIVRSEGFANSHLTTKSYARHCSNRFLSLRSISALELYFNV